MKTDFPNYVNFYATFISPTKTELKELFEKNGWKIRKESWEDFEFTNEWSELNLIRDENNPILKGTILNPEINYKTLFELLCNLGAKFQSELYDENSLLLRQDAYP
ncbi:MAG: hypothetical protein QM535_17770 [Limnohabitans sp.]|nr:hypothetical protein [Limnohabitans sp.]